MKVIGVIPARYASTRFPGKPLVMIDGKAMIRRVYEQALKCKSLSGVIVATDHEAIFRHVTSFGGHVMMTSANHQSGTERCAEVAASLERNGENIDIIINIQGDEPYIEPAQIEQLISCFSNPEVQIATLVRKIGLSDDLNNPNMVKVTRDIHGKALYFSRSAIPYIRGKDPKAWMNESCHYQHIGIYGYIVPVLKQLISLLSTPLEKAESLEQLRWMEHGFDIFTMETEFENISIDIPADLLKITNRS